MNINRFFSKEQQTDILQAIREAEKETSGEIRLHVETSCKGDALQRAVELFSKLKMHQTEQRNGTLIYLAMKDRKFAIFGDEGINKQVPENFWQDVREEMREAFVDGHFADGVKQGIKRIGEKLNEFFPYRKDDVNELPDDISFGE